MSEENMSKQKIYAAITVYHEAQGESFRGQVAVAHVIFNRAEIRKCSVEEVVFADKQFSCFNKGRKAIENYEIFITAMNAVEHALSERLEGKTLYGADHYFGTYITPPSWSSNMQHIITIGKHTFFKEVR